MLNINEEDKKVIREIVDRHVPNCEIRAYGSRCRGTARKYSDLDIALVGTGVLGFRIMGSLEEDFDESDLLFRVDFHDWHAIPPSFREIINKNYEVI